MIADLTNKRISSLESLVNRLIKKNEIVLQDLQAFNTKYILHVVGNSYRLLTYFKGYCITRTLPKELSVENLHVTLCRANLEPDDLR